MIKYINNDNDYSDDNNNDKNVDKIKDDMIMAQNQMKKK